ncbi:aminotransferase class I/II-fold pyridoxal phosphate-dependent enzyme [Saprospira sp. CCB-QB6]|uniref:trans-sulfuration enzyme family protein n=1 Tax=Saprospira sp. CCB-QB6 TaxID=3023936 RepID=UPI002349C3B5|nr:aminotransferase class I/II-fold pyridoxal phosphate-dependent enzyme [Saprospira sp. CCB-QB6]WCL82492.1 aminotransferase class I/II-fold pyridoxal phosphate-dependent enzyme [Saprospira sp. CCB-QB6]
MDTSYLLTHLGEEREDYFNAVIPPIVQSSNFSYDSLADFRSAILNELDNFVYTRGNNPTVAILRQKLAALEQAEDALVFGSGSAACAVAIISQLQAGDHLLSVQSPYSWTFKLISKFLSRFGISYDFIDASDLQQIEAAIRPNTKVLFLESPNSLTFELQDLAACAALAKKHGIRTICDNSYASPIYQNPIALGIDLVIHSATKYLNGHSDVVAGVVCGSKALIQKMFELDYMALGPAISPNDAWLLLRGLRTLPLRIQKANEHAKKVVDYLAQHPKVDYVLYPGHPSHPQYELAQKQMSGFGGLFSVNFKAKRIEQMERFSEALMPTFLLAVSWGGFESLQVPTACFYNLGTAPPPPLPFSFVRYYVGLEDPDYIIDAFEKAFVHLED